MIQKELESCNQNYEVAHSFYFFITKIKLRVRYA